MTSFMAETAALGAAMAAMGPYVPNFVSTAIVAAWQARAMGMIGRQQAAMATQRTQMTPAMAAAAADIARLVQANPRVVWLGQLAMNKQCEPPSIVSK